MEHLASELHDLRNLIYFLYAFLVGVFCALWAQKAGRSAFGWFIVGVLFSGLTLIVLLFANANRPKCPYCLGCIMPGSKRCMNCGSDIPRCPACSRQIGLGKPTKCRHCGEILDDEEAEENMG